MNDYLKVNLTAVVCDLNSSQQLCALKSKYRVLYW